MKVDLDFKAGWQTICDETQILMMPTGMLVRTFTLDRHDEVTTSEALEFVPGNPELLQRRCIEILDHAMMET